MHTFFRKPLRFSLTLLLSVFCAASILVQQSNAQKQNAPVPAVPESSKPSADIPSVQIIRPDKFDKETISFKATEHGEEDDALEKSIAETKLKGNHEFKAETVGRRYYFSISQERLKSPDIDHSGPRVDGQQTVFRELLADLADDSRRVGHPDDPAKDQGSKGEGFRWRSAISQSLMFLGIQHGFALVTQSKTRQAMRGKFWNDYGSSVKSLNGWGDGGRFFTNYIAHPLQGSFTGFIYVQNDPNALKQQFGSSGKYWRSRLKALAWSTAWSTQFEIGPVSQASIGNVGLKGKQTWGDVVVTPTVGTAMLVTEDAIDRFIIKRIERSTSNFYIRIFSRMFLSPTRTVANLFRFKEPWYRDRPTGH